MASIGCGRTEREGRGMAEYQKFRWNVVKCWSELQSRLFDLQRRGKWEGITDARFNAWHRGYTVRNFFASWSWRGKALTTAAYQIPLARAWGNTAGRTLQEKAGRNSAKNLARVTRAM